MSKLSKTKNSRAKWKQKSIDRGNKLRASNKENKRVKCERDHYKNKVRQLKNHLKE